MNITSLQASGGAAISLVQSMLDDIEKRRVEEEEKASGKKEDKVLKAKVTADDVSKSANAKINEHFFNRDVIDINELKVALIDDLGERLGIVREDGQSGFSYGRQIEQAIDQLDSQALFALNDALGLSELGVSLEEIIKAIKNPYGKEDDKLELALEERATGVSGTYASRAKVVQRLESVADPKSLEELKLEKAGEITDPTKVEDAETKAEREEEIGALEAAEKLDDVKDLQQTVKTQNDQAAKPSGEQTGSTDSAEAIEIAMTTIQVLAAGAEAAESAETSQAAGETAQNAASASGTDNTNGDEDVSMSEQDEVYLLETNGPPIAETSGMSLLTVQVDEDGIYDILLHKKAA